MFTNMWLSCVVMCENTSDELIPLGFRLGPFGTDLQALISLIAYCIMAFPHDHPFLIQMG